MLDDAVNGVNRLRQTFTSYRNLHVGSKVGEKQWQAAAAAAGGGPMPDTYSTKERSAEEVLAEEQALTVSEQMMLHRASGSGAALAKSMRSRSSRYTEDKSPVNPGSVSPKPPGGSSLLARALRSFRHTEESPRAWDLASSSKASDISLSTSKASEASLSASRASAYGSPPSSIPSPSKTGSAFAPWPTSPERRQSSGGGGGGDDEIKEHGLDNFHQSRPSRMRSAHPKSVARTESVAAGNTSEEASPFPKPSPKIITAYDRAIAATMAEQSSGKTQEEIARDEALAGYQEPPDSRERFTGGSRPSAGGGRYHFDLTTVGKKAPEPAPKPVPVAPAFKLTDILPGLGTLDYLFMQQTAMREGELREHVVEGKGPTPRSRRPSDSSGLSLQSSFSKSGVPSNPGTHALAAYTRTSSSICRASDSGMQTRTPTGYGPAPPARARNHLRRDSFYRTSPSAVRPALSVAIPDAGSDNGLPPESEPAFSGKSSDKLPTPSSSSTRTGAVMGRLTADSVYLSSAGKIKSRDKGIWQGSDGIWRLQ